MRESFKEVSISYIEGDAKIGIYASTCKGVNYINKLKKQYPDEVIINHVNPDGSICADLLNPDEWRILPRRKRADTQTPEQKAKAAERMANARKAKENKEN